MPEADVATFDELRRQFERGGAEALLEDLARRLREAGKYHDLFDLRLMQARARLGLSVVAPSGLDDLEEPLRGQVEQAYLEACREVGHLLLEQGHLREAWMYLRPVGDKQPLAAALERLDPQSCPNLQELIELALHEGIAPRLGFEWVLAHYGTCNAITMFDSLAHAQPRDVRAEIAGLLVRRLHGELVHSLRHEIARQQGSPPTEPTIRELLADRDWLFGPDSYHIDTSHLHAVVRFARHVIDPQVLRLALDLTEYGRRLGRQFQYAGDEPFADSYPAHALFFRAQLGEAVEEALTHFRSRAEAADPAQQGGFAAEVYVALLVRLGRPREALDELARLVPVGVALTGFAPGLAELARTSGQLRRYEQICRQRSDLLGYAAALAAGAAADARLPTAQ